MARLAIAFGLGAVSGALFVRWYVMRHAGSLAGDAIGEKIFGENSTGAKVVSGILGIVDDVRA